jgi:SPP1 family phage portal protein
MNTGFTTLRFTGEEQHFYHQVPVTVFSLNPEEKSIFDKIMGLQDAYNTLLSSEVDDFEAFCDAYLVLKNVTATADDVAEMKEKRVIVLPYAAQGVDPDASFLNKNISDTQIENILTNIDEQIHKISNSPDFTDEAFGTSSGVAMKYKLLGFENTAGAIAANMTKALQKRLELICEILNLTSGEQMWRDVEITFTRNLPVDLAETANLVNTLKGTVSDRTLLSLLPFVSDIDKELEMVEESKLRNIELYSFSSNSTSDEVEETE